MAFSRLPYDKLAYDLQIKRSTEEGAYRLFPSFGENKFACFASDGIIGSKSDVSLPRYQTTLNNESVIDAENKLSWRHNLLSKNNINNNPINSINVIHKQQCIDKLSPEDTRFTYPLDDYRCMSLLDYEYIPYLHVNPQCYIQEIYDKIGLNTRLYAKDVYKPPKHKFWDTGISLPKENVYYNNDIDCYTYCSQKK